MLRLFVAIPIAALVTLALFLFMQSMIDQEPELSQPRVIPEIVITAKPPEPIGITPEPVDIPEPPAPPVIDEKMTVDPPTGVTSPGPGPVEPPPDGLTIIGSPGGGNAIVTIAPQFPERCKSRSANAAVIVEFDVSETGEVVNPRIIASDDSCFDREVLRTILRWKFAPEVENGKPVAQRGLRRVFRFQLED
ncbi:MAG: TonB family protein [Pseudomonadota bacterium]